ncbi:uncharacterized protein LOC134184648 isoform X2 [Corticium candelabrum]|uniref:uncharacterized protein LOC134184648 isoform X2 n=1 Tax=Corticium candelabrum TaxID=121492 RepID=UPI002E30E862|nr:uncharacterized protein LOC134184648 isoform X2 [Corticium candelabrum]
MGSLRIKTWRSVFTAPFFKLFGSHAIGYTSALEIQRRLKHNGKFTSFITEAEANSGHILSALLIIPIQRIPRYELLLKELLKHTDKDHPDYGDLTLALTKIQTVASGINESIRAIENELQLIILTKRFPHDQLHLINESRQFNSLRLKASRTQSMRAVKDNRKWLPHSRTVSVPALMYMAQSDDRLKLLDFGPRRVIREGAVQIIKPESRETTERYLVLLNDLILISQSVSKTKPQYKLKDRSLLAQVWIEDSQNCDDELSDRALVLGTPSTLHKIIFSSTEDKKQWFEDLSKYVCEQKQAAIYMLKGLGIPNQVMLSCNMKCRVDYRGLDDFELKLKHGSEVNVYGVIGDDGKWRPSLFPDGDEVMEFTWWYGDVGKSVGWFPCGCLMEADKAMAEIELSELKQLPMKQFLSVRKKFAEWTGNTFERLLDPVVKVHGTDNSYKALIIPDSATAADVIRIYLSRKSCIETNETVSWSLREVSADKSVNILLSPDAVLPKRIDSWGCCKDKMSFQLEEQAGSED